jgi:flagellar motility protein MotE (MotC chaperone)
MKAGRRGPVLLSVMLCALIAVLLVKLAITIAGAFFFQPEAAISVPDAMAKDDKQKADNAVQADKPPKSKPGPSSTDSLNAIQQKETEIRKREEQLKEKEERLAKLEKEVEQKVKDLLVLQKEVQAVRTEKIETQNVKVRSLAKIYGSMKPKEAAKLMENLDDKLVMNIIATMTPDEAASILALMDVKKAAKISEALSSR